MSSPLTPYYPISGNIHDFPSAENPPHGKQNLHALPPTVDKMSMTPLTSLSPACKTCPPLALACCQSASSISILRPCPAKAKQYDFNVFLWIPPASQNSAASGQLMEIWLGFLSLVPWADQIINALADSEGTGMRYFRKCRCEGRGARAGLYGDRRVRDLHSCLLPNPLPKPCGQRFLRPAPGSQGT